MNQISSFGYETFSGAQSFYPSEEELHMSRCMNMDSNLRRSIFNTEFDGYSDVSIDTSSSFSFDNSDYFNYTLNQNRYIHSGSRGESLMEYGIGSLNHSESPHSSRYSDDEMSELLPFDQARLLSPQIFEDEDEIRYLRELIHKDMIAAELGMSYPRSMDDACWNIDPILQDLQEDFIPSTQIISEAQDKALYYEDKLHDLYVDDKPCKINPNVNRIAENPNNRKNNNQKDSLKTKPTHLHKKVGSTQSKPEVESSLKVASKVKVENKQVRSTNNDEQRVFLGGLPIGMTERMLRNQLAEKGYKVLKRPKILHGFAPEVWMKTVDQAKDLIRRGTILIDGMEVEVRPYNSLTKLSELKKLPNVGRRSIFMGGLSSGTTTKNLQDALSNMGMKVINYPVIRHGFARQIILDTISQARILIKMKKILVNGTYADVRPFVNQKRWRRTKK